MDPQNTLATHNAGYDFTAIDRAPKLQPRTKAKYRREIQKMGVSITQISVLLGHSSVKTTQEYLNLNLDLESTASDFVPLAG